MENHLEAISHLPYLHYLQKNLIVLVFLFGCFFPHKMLNLYILQAQATQNIVSVCSCFHHGQTHNHSSGLVGSWSFLQVSRDSLGSNFALLTAEEQLGW